jgi:hypothetical protein
MNKLITILLIAGGLWGIWALRNYYLEKQSENPNMNYSAEEGAKTPGIIPQQLQGMHYSLEMPLQKAMQGGAPSLKKFLDQYRPVIKDPRLAWIELDYVAMVALKDPAEARALFADVKKRTPTNSVIYPRIEKLAKVYE